MATTLTPFLKLKVDSNLSASARYNLYRIDTLGETFLIDNQQNVRLQSAEDVILQPQDTSIGGTGGGNIFLAQNAAPAENVYVNADNIFLSSAPSFKDSASSNYLKLQYNSALSSPAAADDYTLFLDLQNADRDLVLGTDFSLLPFDSASNSLSLQLSAANTALTLPEAGTLATLAGEEVFTNKDIDADSNTIYNLDNGNIKANAGVVYSKLDLAGSILNADIAPSAGIVYSKLNLSNSILNTDVAAGAGIAYAKLDLAGSIQNSDISTSANISYTKLNLTNTLVNSDVSPSAAISRAKLAAGTGNWVVINAPDGSMSQEQFLDKTRGGTGISSGATFPASGTIATDVNTLVFQNKTISGANNTFSSIPYSALSLGNSIVNADIAPLAAIAYSKLNLSTSIVNADINATAAIAGTKISPSFGAQEISTTDSLKLSNGTNYNKLFTSGSQAFDITYTLPTVAPLNGQLLATDSSGQLAWQTVVGSGTVTSVGFSAPNDLFAVTGAPVTTAGTITLSKQTANANRFYAGPSMGSPAVPTFRAIVTDDLPSGIPASDIGAGTVDDTEFGYLDGVTSSVQSQIDGKQPLDGDLTALSALSSTGILARTASDTYALRTITAGTGISITNGNGISGNPTIDSTITQYTDEMAQDAVGGILGATSNIVLSYSDSTPSITGDLTDTTVSPGSFGSASSVGTFTVDQKGRLTAAASTSIQIAEGQVTNLVSDLASKVPNTRTITAGTGLTGGGDLSADRTVALADTAVSPGTYGTASAVSTITVDQQGRLTAASNTPIAITASQVTDFSAAAQSAVGLLRFSATWTNGDGTSKVVTHSLGTRDVVVQLYNTTTFETVYVDSIVRTSTSVVTLTASEAPATSWKVLIIALT